MVEGQRELSQCITRIPQPFILPIRRSVHPIAELSQVTQRLDAVRSFPAATSATCTAAFQAQPYTSGDGDRL